MLYSSFVDYVNLEAVVSDRTLRLVPAIAASLVCGLQIFHLFFVAF